MFQISDKATSCTQVPGVWPLNDDAMLVDCPGFGDSNETLEFPNQTLIHQVVRKAKVVIVCIILKGATLDSGRGSAYISIMTAVSRMLS